MAAVVLTDDQGNIYIHKRPSKGLLANLWEFPNVETQKESKQNATSLSYF